MGLCAGGRQEVDKLEEELTRHASKVQELNVKQSDMQAEVRPRPALASRTIPQGLHHAPRSIPSWCIGNIPQFGNDTEHVTMGCVVVSLTGTGHRVHSAKGGHFTGYQSGMGEKRGGGSGTNPARAPAPSGPHAEAGEQRAGGQAGGAQVCAAQ